MPIAQHWTDCHHRSHRCFPDYRFSALVIYNTITFYTLYFTLFYYTLYFFIPVMILNPPSALMPLSIPLFSLMRIRIRIILLIRVMRICGHRSTDAPRLHFERPRLHLNVQGPSCASKAPRIPDPRSRIPDLGSPISDPDLESRCF